MGTRKGRRIAVASVADVVALAWLQAVECFVASQIVVVAATVVR